MNRRSALLLESAPHAYSRPRPSLATKLGCFAWGHLGKLCKPRNRLENRLEFSINDLVEVHGLLDAKELNGRWGQIVGFVGAGSIGVKLHGRSEIHEFQPFNLRRRRTKAVCHDSPMPAAFMESTPNTPVFQALLVFLPAKAMLSLALCCPTLRAEVENADAAWELLIASSFGGDLKMAQQRCLQAVSTFQTFVAMMALRANLGKVEIVRGDLSEAAKLGVEAAVCPAHPLLQHGPAARAVFDRAGEELADYMAKLQMPMEIGEAHWSPGFGLGTQGLVHAVVPDRSTRDGDRKLRQAYAAALAQVLQHGHRSVAIGSISSGENGFQPKLAASIAIEEVRNALSKHASARELRLVFVASDSADEEAFRSSLSQMRRRVNQDLLEVLPVIVLDSMVPKQRLSFTLDRLPVAIRSESSRFAMLGMDPQRGVLSSGVEVQVSSRSVEAGSMRVDVVAGRRFSLPGSLQREEGEKDERGRAHMLASVTWAEEDEQAPTQADLKVSATLEPLVDQWLSLVRSGRERTPGQMDIVLEGLGPMPPVEKISDRALWVCALINPLPAQGEWRLWEVRPYALMAASARERLAIAAKGIYDSIAHLDGSRPMGSWS